MTWIILYEKTMFFMCFIESQFSILLIPFVFTGSCNDQAKADKDIMALYQQFRNIKVTLCYSPLDIGNKDEMPTIKGLLNLFTSWIHGY